MTPRPSSFVEIILVMIIAKFLYFTRWLGYQIREGFVRLLATATQHGALVWLGKRRYEDSFSPLFVLVCGKRSRKEHIL
jgi:hypothetical protein